MVKPARHHADFDTWNFTAADSDLCEFFRAKILAVNVRNETSVREIMRFNVLCVTLTRKAE